MYVKICKGDAVSLNFKILEYKIPDYQMFAGNRINEVEEVISLIVECGYPYKIMGISEKEKDYLVGYFHDYFLETEADYSILRKCLEWKNAWYVTSERDDVVRIADYLEHVECMANWAKECIKFLKEKGEKN